MSAHRIDFYINTSDSLRKVARHAKRLANLEQVFLKAAPPSLARACRVKQLCSGTLVLLAENGAIAAKLKQLTPRLLTAYQELGREVTSIQIEVQVREAAQESTQNRKKTSLSIESIENLERVAATLDESPLKRALASLAVRQRSYR